MGRPNFVKTVMEWERIRGNRYRKLMGFRKRDVLASKIEIR